MHSAMALKIKPGGRFVYFSTLTNKTCFYACVVLFQKQNKQKNPTKTKTAVPVSQCFAELKSDKMTKATLVEFGKLLYLSKCAKLR